MKSILTCGIMGDEEESGLMRVRPRTPPGGAVYRNGLTSRHKDTRIKNKRLCAFVALCDNRKEEPLCVFAALCETSSLR
jgi:hypothetical protein